MKTKTLTMLGVAGSLGAYPGGLPLLPRKRKRGAKPLPVTRERALAVLLGIKGEGSFYVVADHPSLPALRKAQKLGWVILTGASPVRATITEKGRAALSQVDSDS